MLLDALTPPSLDPTPIFELFRGSYGTELLAAAVAEFRLFERLEHASKPADTFRAELGLQERPFAVLTTALRAMGLLHFDAQQRVELTPMSREHLLPGGAFYVGDYVGLAAQSPGVREMIARLKTNRPAGGEDKDKGAAFIFRAGVESAMELEASARHLTLALAGRAKNVAPYLAEKFDLSQVHTLLDVGGGTGIYSIACLQKNPKLRAIIFDRPEVLKVAGEFAKEYGVQDRLDLVPGDMFADPLPKDADAILLSNILHDWDIPECRALIAKCARSLHRGGRLAIHDVFLNDHLDGPLPIALYSAALFTLTEGRAYSAKEYTAWLSECGLKVQPVQKTLIHCGVLVGEK